MEPSTLEAIAERVRARIAVQHRAHVVREVLGAPYPLKTGIGVAIEFRAREPVRYQAAMAREDEDIGHRQIEPLRPSPARCGLRPRPRNSCPNWIGSTTKLRIAAMPFSMTGPSRSCPAIVAGESKSQLVPDAVVRPVPDVRVRLYLDVESTDGRRPEAVERESEIVTGVDEFVGRWRDGRQDSEPGKRELVVVFGEASPVGSSHAIPRGSRHSPR